MSLITSGRRLAAAVATSLLLLSVVGAPAASARSSSWSHRDAHVCAQPGAGQVRCTSVAREFYRNGRTYQSRSESALAAAAAAAQATYYNGTSIRTAYGMTAQGDPSLVVAIVDANDDPNAFANVTRFRSDSGLPAIQSCTLATLTTLTSSATSPCFTKTNQTGGTSLPAADAGWSNEIDLDLQAASAVCPMCSILLLEATSASVTNLATAVTTASNTPHVRSISNSYGISGDYPASLAPDYDNAAKKGIAVTASAGDGGYGVLFPASATNVIGVGGTTLSVNATGVRTTETAWAGTGSGCSVYNAAPAWQSIPGNPCAGKKAISDVSADADPNSGLAIYTTYNNTTGYWVFGGTSLSSPIIAALYARQGGYNASTLAGQYAWAATTPYYDVTSGKNTTGSCSPSVLCTAGVGWDGPTGRGSIAGPSAPSVLTTITVSPTSASVQTGGKQQFTATGKDQFGQPMSPQPVTWSVAPGDSTIDSSGLVTAGATTGTFTVTATNGSVKGTANLTVTAVPQLTTITVSPTSASVQTGGKQQFTATGKDQFGQPMSPQPVTWSVAPGDSTIDSSGLVTAGATTGTFTVTATNGSVKGTANLTVTSMPVDFSLGVSPTAQSVRRGGTATYTVTITPVNGFNGSVTLSLSGQPSGSTVTFTPNPATGTATLTVRTLSTTSRRTYAMTIRGVSGSLSHSASASLTVTR